MAVKTYETEIIFESDEEEENELENDCVESAKEPSSIFEGLLTKPINLKKIKYAENNFVKDLLNTLIQENFDHVEELVYMIKLNKINSYKNYIKNYLPYLIRALVIFTKIYDPANNKLIYSENKSLKKFYLKLSDWKKLILKLIKDDKDRSYIRGENYEKVEIETIEFIRKLLLINEYPYEYFYNILETLVRELNLSKSLFEEFSKEKYFLK